MDAAKPSRRPGGRKAARTHVAALLAGVLISLALAAGCAGDEETSGDATEDQTTKQDTQQASTEPTKDRTETTTQAQEGAGGKLSSQEAMLEVNGNAGTEFSGSCAVGGEEMEIGGQVPERFVYELDGGRLECEITKESADSSSLEVVFTVGENTRSVQQISGGTLNLTYENGRISSSSTSSSGSGAQVSSSQVVSSSQSGSSSIKISP